MTGRAFLAAALMLGVAGCSNAFGRTAEDSYRRGLAALEEGEASTARVELLNAIKLDPSNGPVRLAQGRAFLLLGDGAAAEAELRRAQAAGIPPAETHHLLAHAYLLEGRPAAAAAEAAKAPTGHRAYASRILANAQAALDDYAAAAAAFNQALAAAPDDPQLWTDIGRFRRGAGDLAAAVEAADRALAFDPEHVEAISLRGELTRDQQGLAAALPWFDRALEIDPDHVPALAERAATLADIGRMKEMLADTRRILSLPSGHEAAYYLQATLAARAGKFDLARSLYERTKGAFEHQPAGMLLASAIDLETGKPGRASQRLRKLVELQPDNAKARRLLAAAEWRMGNGAATVAALRPIAERRDAEPYELALIGRALAKQGDRAAAAAYLARAARPATATAVPLGPPVSDQALAALRSEAAARPDAGAQVPLIRALLGRGLGAEALDRARALQAANPHAPEAHLLVGDALSLQAQPAAAAQEYRRAAAIAFTEPVALRLVEALRNAGDSRGAAGVLTAFLQQNPQSVPAQRIAADNFLRAGQWERAAALYETLRTRLGSRDATLLNNLAWAYAQSEDYERALPLAQRAWELDRANPATADTYGWLLFKSGEDRVRGLALLKLGARRG